MNDEARLVDAQVDKNPFALAGRRDQGSNGGGMVAVASSRQAQEVQAAMVIAKKFPRNEAEAFNRIMTSCKRKTLAEEAMYAYPKGGKTITGPSISLAKAMAQSWGNIDFGIVELEQRDGASTVMAFCWDLETNVRETRIFEVSHEIEKKGGVRKLLTDPREIYEMAANYGARRLRACILGILPEDLKEAAVSQCETTLKGGSTVPLVDRCKKMALVFQEEFQVSVHMLEKRLGHRLDATNETEFVGLKKIYVSLRDGMSKREDWFMLADGPEQMTGEQTQPSHPQTSDVLGEKPKRTRRPSPSNAPTPASAVEAEVVSHPEPATAPESTPPPADASGAVVFPVIGPDRSRMIMVTAIQKAATESGIALTRLTEVISAMQFGPPGTLLSQLPSASLEDIVDAWSEVAAFARGN